MNVRVRDAIRITIAAALKAAATCSAVGAAWSLVRMARGGVPAHFVLLMIVLFGAITAALAANRCYHRRWRDLFKVVAAVAAITIYAFANALPRDTGLYEAARQWAERTDLGLFMMFIPLFFLVAPIWLAHRFWLACAAFAARRIPNGPDDTALPPLGAPCDR